MRLLSQKSVRLAALIGLLFTVGSAQAHTGHGTSSLMDGLAHPLGADHLLARVDETRFRQVVANLFDNAVKYTEGGGCIHVTLSQEADGIAISVRDTGVGIPLADIPKIFDRLYRSDKSRHKKGLGLGLSLAKAIINAHHGRIEVESQLGEGSNFTLFILAEPEMPFNGAKALRMT